MPNRNFFTIWPDNPSEDLLYAIQKLEECDDLLKDARKFNRHNERYYHKQFPKEYFLKVLFKSIMEAPLSDYIAWA
jgi:hypothetical protein